MLDNDYALLFIRGERAVKDLKYDIMRHPNIKYTEDGGAKPYIHGNVDEEHADVEILWIRDIKKNEKKEEVDVEETGYELLSDEDLLCEIEQEEKNDEEENEQRHED